MTDEIRPGAFKDAQAIILESDRLRVTLVPELGGKIASLVNLRTGFECLYQLPSSHLRRASYAAPFSEGECAGFDDMFPSIDPCYCDVAPWAGTSIPDHGELWSVPWQASAAGNEVVLTAHGVRFPYRFTKHVSLERPDTVLIRYRVDNLSNFDFPALWAAHPLFNITESTRIIVPTGANRIINTVPAEALGGFGEQYDWPLARTRCGNEWDLSRIRPNLGRHCFKFYFTEPLSEGFAILHDPASRETVGLSWPADKVPYLGFWISEGAYAGQYDAAPEPCTAPLDRWDTARQWGKLPTIPGFGFSEWTLRIGVGLYDNPGRMEADGTIL